MAAGNLIVGFPLNGNSPTSQQFFDRLLTPPTVVREALYSDLINSLVSTGVWSKLDVLYLFAATDIGTALVNLVSGKYQAFLTLLNNLPSFVADRGFTGANLSLIESGFSPSTATAANYQLNDAMVMAAIDTSLSLDQFDHAIALSADIATWISPRNNSDLAKFAVNCASFQNVTNSGAQSGIWLAQRTSSSASELFRDNSSIGTSAIASSALPSGNLRSGSAYQLTAFAAGASLNSGQRGALQSAIAAYMAAVGA